METINVKLLTQDDFKADCRTFERKAGREPTEQEKKERLHAYECSNINALRDALFVYDHETLEGYSMDAHTFTIDVDERLTKWDTSNIDSFNEVLIKTVEEWKGVKITQTLPSPVDIDTLTDETNIVSIHYTIGDYDWYIATAEKTSNGDYYCYGLVKFLCTERGHFMLSEIIRNGAVLDESFTPVPMEALE